MDGAAIRYAKSDNVDVAYQVLGADSPDLLVLSSAVLPIDSMSEEPLLARFHDRLASFSRVIRFDMRGVGMSDPVSPSDPPTLEQWVRDGAAVLKAAGSEQASLFAPRDSALQGVLMASTYPDRISSLVIVNGTARAMRSDDYSFGIPKRVLDRFLEVNMQSDAVDRGFDLLRSAAPSVANDGAFRAWWDRAGRRGASPATSRAIQSVYLRADVRPLLPMVQVPTLIVHRRENAIFRVEHGRYLAEHIADAKYVELPGGDDLYWVGDTDEMLDEIQEFLTGTRLVTSTDRVLATVLFTDIVESTKRAADSGDRRWRDLLDQHDTMAGREVHRFDGRQIKSTGDGILATFDGPARAIQCGLALRQGARRLGLDIRVGVHTGELERRGDDVAGIAVHIAARIRSCAHPGEVWVSRTVTDLVTGSGINFSDRGEHQLKGVPGAWQLFAVAA